MVKERLLNGRIWVFNGCRRELVGWKYLASVQCVMMGPMDWAMTEASGCWIAAVRAMLEELISVAETADRVYRRAYVVVFLVVDGTG